MDITIFGISLAAILLLTGLTWWLLPTQSELTNTAVLRALALSAPGQRLIRVILSKEGKAGIATLDDGSLMICRAFGDKIVIQPLETCKHHFDPPSARLTIAASATHAALTLDLAEASRRDLNPLLNAQDQQASHAA